jgi:hypothetical protein
VVVYYPESDTGSDAAAVRSETSIWDKVKMALKLEGLLVKRLVTKPARKFDGLARSQGTAGEGTLNVQH